jgi:hypothetical protein
VCVCVRAAEKVVWEIRSVEEADPAMLAEFPFYNQLQGRGACVFVSVFVSCVLP